MDVSFGHVRSLQRTGSGLGVAAFAPCSFRPCDAVANVATNPEGSKCPIPISQVPSSRSTKGMVFGTKNCILLGTPEPCEFALLPLDMYGSYSQYYGYVVHVQVGHRIL